MYYIIDRYTKSMGTDGRRALEMTDARPNVPHPFSNSLDLTHPATMAPLEIPHDLIGQSSLYNHPDPLLRRLRLDDSSGGSITDLDRAFKGKEVVVLYAGSEHGSSTFHIPF